MRDYRTRGSESRDTLYLLGMFVRLLRALDFLTAQPEWDGRTVIVHGSSQGGYQSLVAAGLDPRVTFFAAGIPAGCDLTGLVVGRSNGPPSFFNRGQPVPPNVLEAVRYYDTMNFAARTNAAGIITVGFVDPLCTPSSVYAAYNSLPGKKEIFNDPLGPHSISAGANAAMRNAIFAHVQQITKKKTAK